MGLFGKSKKDKEEEVRQEENRRKREAEQRASDQLHYDEIVRGIEKVKSMNPKWDISRVGYEKNHYGSKDYLCGHMSYKSNDHILVTILLNWHGNHNPYDLEDEATIAIEKIESRDSRIVMLSRHCRPNKSPGLRQDEWEQLYNYAYSIFEPQIRRQHDEEQAMKQKQQTVKDEFWSK